MCCGSLFLNTFNGIFKLDLTGDSKLSTKRALVVGIYHQQSFVKDKLFRDQGNQPVEKYFSSTQVARSTTTT